MQSMDVRVEHKGNDITNKVISYSREHKICTGIGTLEMDVTDALTGDFDPWDKIEIFEDGGLAGRYYVSKVSDNQPEATITVECQDNSKRLTDYFISDSYFVDYPSYSKYWISKFLDECKISYIYTTDDEGNLLSNNTSLGLMTAYEQITMLLQLNGWYIRFDNDKAKIGKLGEDTTSKATFTPSNVTDIQVIRTDKMLRNRAVVWGKLRPLGGYITAELSKITPWNYDSRDYRSVVLANGYIPTTAAALSIAAKLLAEFSNLIVEKHITAIGTYNLDVGKFATVKMGRRVWQGKGLITTLGVDMSKDGLVTRVVLDEKCPRLFAFYNFGDYVYIGTDGSGIWRKRLNGSTWENFSDGLVDLRTADLHINNGVMASVAGDGGCYVTTDDFSGWVQVSLSGVGITDAFGAFTPASGILRGRACIVDKINNTAKFAVDNGPYETERFYTPTLSGVTLVSSGVTGSGVVNVSEMRSWIVETNYSGIVLNTYPVVISTTISGTSFSGATPSGAFTGTLIFDIENDGSNDFISALVPGGDQFFETAPANYGFDYNSRLTIANFDYVPSGVNPQTVFTSPYRIHAARTRDGGQGYYATMGDKNSSAPNGVFGWSFYTSSGIVEAAYSSINAVKVTEFSSGTYVEHSASTVGESASKALIGVEKISDTIYDYVYLDYSIGATTDKCSVTYTRFDKSTDTILLSNIKFGEMSHRNSYNSAEDTWSAPVQMGPRLMLKVAHLVYKLSYVTDSNTGASPTNGKLYLDVIDLAIKQVYNYLIETSDINNIVGHAALMQWYRGYAIYYIKGTNTGGTENNVWRTTHVYRSLVGDPNYPPNFEEIWSGTIGVPSDVIEFPAGNFHSLDNARSWNDLMTSNGVWVMQYNPNRYSVESFFIATHIKNDGVYGADHYYRKDIIDTNASISTQDFDSTTAIGLDQPHFTRPFTLGGLWETRGFGYEFNGDGDTLGFLDTQNPETFIGNFSMPPTHKFVTLFPSEDDVSYNFYILGQNVITSGFDIIPVDLNGTTLSALPFPGLNYYNVDSSNNITYAANALNCFVVMPYTVNAQFSGIVTTNYYYDPALFVGSYTYGVLERIGNIFIVMQQFGLKPRLDISKTAPLVIAQDVVGTLEPVYASLDTVLTYTFPAGIGLVGSGGSVEVLKDYRYTDISISGVIQSGLSVDALYDDATYSGSEVSRRLLFVTESGLYTSDINSPASGVLYETYGGEATFSGITQLEASNNSYDYQYIFVSTSNGGNVEFFQKDPLISSMFVPYPSGLPQSSITRIRVDEIV